MGRQARSPPGAVFLSGHWSSWRVRAPCLWGNSDQNHYTQDCSHSEDIGEGSDGDDEDADDDDLP